MKTSEGSAITDINITPFVDVVLVLSVLIDEQGSVRDASIVESLAVEMDAEALRAIKKYRFSPAKSEDIPIGEREWVINVTGYKRFKEKFIYEKDSEVVKIYLEKQSYTEFETTVIGKIEKQDPAKKTLQQKEFLQAPGAGGDPIRAIENLPGVGQSFDANVAIEGSPPEDTKYLIEGHEIPFMFHFLGLNTVVTPETVKSVDFLSAGYGPEFGRAASGVINLNLRRPRTGRIHGMAFLILLP